MLSTVLKWSASGLFAVLEILFDFSERAARLERAGGSTHDAHSQFYLHYSHIAAI